MIHSIIESALPVIIITVCILAAYALNRDKNKKLFY